MVNKEPDWSSFHNESQRSHADLILDLALRHGQNTPEAHQQLAMELSNMIRALEWMQEHTRWDDIACLLVTLWEKSRFLQDRGPAPTYLSAGKSRLLPAVNLLLLLERGALAARKLEDNDKLCTFLNALGGTLRAMGKVDEAIERHNDALSLARQLESKSSIRQTLSLLGMVWIDKDLNQAMPHLQEALDITIDTNDVTVDIDLFAAIATVHARLGQKEDFEKANVYIEKALALVTESQNTRRQLELYHLRGYLRSLTDDLDNARSDFQKVAELSESINHHWARGRALEAMGDLTIQIGQSAQDNAALHQGIAELEQALTLLKQTGDGAAIIFALEALGRGYISTGQLDTAQAKLEHALEVIQAFTDLPQLATFKKKIQSRLTNVQHMKGEYRNAVTITNIYSDNY